MASTPLDTIPEEPTAAPTPPNSPSAAPTPKSPATSARVTADPPQTKPAKNPGRVASGKRLAERNRLAREAKKKAQAKAASATACASTSASSATTSDNSGSGGFFLLTLLGIGGLIVSAAGVYYQREAIQARFRAAPHAQLRELVNHDPHLEGAVDGELVLAQLDLVGVAISSRSVNQTERRCLSTSCSLQV